MPHEEQKKNGERPIELNIQKNSYPLLQYMPLSMAEQLEHGRMVSNIAYLLGKELGLKEKYLHNLIVAGYFHDIGKMILEEDLNGNVLMVEKLSSIRQHPNKSSEILRSHGYNDTICEAVLHHHENFDGRGFPENLAGHRIPLEARILRVCDVFCARVSDRPYRSAFPTAETLEMMIEELEWFDMKVFLALQRMLPRNEKGEPELPAYQEEVKGVWKTLWH